MIEAIAKAFSATTTDVRRAVMATGDIGSVAVAARTGALHGVRISYGVPIGFMMASPLQFGSFYRELFIGEWLIEDKFDGIRVQAHKADGKVRLFSRTANDVSHSYPEVVDALSHIPEDFILDGEIIAQHDGKVLPFRYLLDEPLMERRSRLARLIESGEQVALVQARVLDGENTAQVLHENFEAARERGHEGLVLKRADSPYHPGRRGNWWLKLKREPSTFDVVVVAVEWGHGKRAKVLSGYTVHGDGGQLVTIGKAYSGLTDAEIADLTQWFLQHQTGRRGHAIAVEPRVVLEVAFDIIQPSELHESGFALRFPRIARIRDDKPVEQIDTVGSVRQIYSAMLQRESVTP